MKDDPHKLFDPGNAAESFAYGLGRVDNLGTVSRLVFYVPRLQDGAAVNEVTYTLIVPTDQLPSMARMLVQAPSVSIAAQADAATNEMRH